MVYFMRHRLQYEWLGMHTQDFVSTDNNVCKTSKIRMHAHLALTCFTDAEHTSEPTTALTSTARSGDIKTKSAAQEEPWTLVNITIACVWGGYNSLDGPQDDSSSGISAQPVAAHAGYEAVLHGVIIIAHRAAESVRHRL